MDPSDILTFIVANKWWFIALIPIAIVIIVVKIRG